jgi:hypothetical protein
MESAEATIQMRSASHLRFHTILKIERTGSEFGLVSGSLLSGI